MNNKIDKQTEIDLLARELKDYEANTKMTNKEKYALRKWVASGSSVYENGSCYSQEKGHSMTFLDAYRHTMDVIERQKSGGKIDE